MLSRLRTATINGKFVTKGCLKGLPCENASTVDIYWKFANRNRVYS